MSVARFHSLCDDKGPTLCFIQSRGYLFGGYNPDHWKSTDNLIEKYLPSSFIFTLTNPHGIPPTRLFPEKDKCSIYHDKKDGIFFDAFVVVSDSKKVNFCSSNNFIDTSGKGNKLFTGKGGYGDNVIDDIFVYSVK